MRCAAWFLFFLGCFQSAEIKAERYAISTSTLSLPIYRSSPYSARCALLLLILTSPAVFLLNEDARSATMCVCTPSLPLHTSSLHLIIHSRAACTWILSLADGLLASLLLLNSACYSGLLHTTLSSQCGLLREVQRPRPWSGEEKSAQRMTQVPIASPPLPPGCGWCAILP